MVKGEFTALLAVHHPSISEEPQKAHIFVFGAIEGREFLLKRCTYASLGEEGVLRRQTDMDDVPSLSEEEMYAYLLKLNKARKGRVGSGSIVLAGVQGGAYLMVTAREYLGAYALKFAPKHQPEVPPVLSHEEVKERINTNRDKKKAKGLPHRPTTEPKNSK